MNVGEGNASGLVEVPKGLITAEFGEFEVSSLDGLSVHVDDDGGTVSATLENQSVGILKIRSADFKHLHVLVTASFESDCPVREFGDSSGGKVFEFP